MEYLCIILIIIVIVLCVLVYTLINKVNTLLKLNDDILKHNSKVLTQVGDCINSQRNTIDNDEVISKLVNEHGNRLAHISHVISMLIEHTKCDALKGYKL